MKNYIILLPVCFMIFISSCERTVKNSNEGRVVRIKSLKDTALQYSVYYPDGIDTVENHPVILGFDPHARGIKVIEAFKEAADEFGYIIVGSDNVRNGLPTVSKIADIAYNDVMRLLPVDKERIYLAGFSGGGRVAVRLALSRKVAGIICCAAGWDIPPDQLNQKIYFYGIVGNEDFNYHEVLHVKSMRDNFNFQYHVDVFEGAHAWPPGDVLRKGLVWFEFNNVRDGRSENQNLIKKYIKNLQKKLITAENDYKKVALLEEGINFLEGIKNMPDWKKQLSVIDIRQIKSRESIIRSLELRLRNEFVLGFEKEDTNWWKERVDMLNKQIQNTKGQDMVHAAYIRTLNYLGMLAFIYTGKAFREEDKRFARECLWIYELVDPDNPDMFYFWAKYLDYDGNKKKARLYLKNAIDAGYHDMKKARNELSREIWEGI